jgi:hypothetical protein
MNGLNDVNGLTEGGPIAKDRSPLNRDTMQIFSQDMLFNCMNMEMCIHDTI